MDPTPDHVLLQSILDAGRDTAATTRDLVDVFRQHAADQARRETEHEAAAQRRHDELRPMLEDYATELRMRRDETARRVGEIIADRKVADDRAAASWAKIRAYALHAAQLAAAAGVAWAAARYGAPLAGGPPPAGAETPSIEVTP